MGLGVEPGFTRVDPATGAAWDRSSRADRWATAAQLTASMKPPPIPMPSVTMAAM